MKIYEPHNRVDVTTPQGDGVIWLVNEYGHETDTMYTIILNNGQIWQFTHKDIVVKDNVTFGRVFTKKQSPVGHGGSGVANGEMVLQSLALTRADGMPNTMNRNSGTTSAVCGHFVGDGLTTTGGKCLNCGHLQHNHIKTISAWDL